MHANDVKHKLPLPNYQCATTLREIVDSLLHSDNQCSFYIQILHPNSPNL